MRLVFLLVSSLCCPETFLTYLLQLHKYKFCNAAMQQKHRGLDYFLGRYFGLCCLRGQCGDRLLRFGQKLPCQNPG